MARPAHVPEATWATCTRNVAEQLQGEVVPEVLDVPGAMVTKGTPFTQMALAPAGAQLVGAIGSVATAAMAPDATTADAWSWNHTMRSCLEDRGIRLP